MSLRPQLSIGLTQSITIEWYLNKISRMTPTLSIEKNSTLLLTGGDKLLKSDRKCTKVELITIKWLNFLLEIETWYLQDVTHSIVLRGCLEKQIQIAIHKDVT